MAENLGFANETQEPSGDQRQRPGALALVLEDVLSLI
jgi:hypothetical protein